MNNNNFIVILLIIIVAAGVAFGAFQFGRMYSGKTVNVEETGKNDEKTGTEAKEEDESENVNVSEETNKEELKEETQESVSQQPVQSSGYTLYKTRNETLYLDALHVSVKANYYLDIVDLSAGKVKYLRREIYFNDHKMLEPTLIYVGDVNENFDQIINDDKIDEYKSFMDPGSDNELVIYTIGDCSNCVIDGTFDSRGYITYAYITTRDGNILKKVQVKNNYCSNIGVLVDASGITGRNYKNSSALDPNVISSGSAPYVLYSDGVLDVYSTYIYYLDTTGGAKEYKFTVMNGIFKEELVKSYPIDNLLQAGGC